MYSSLPSASKIYVQSCKTKQKNLSSAKKKRKKSAASVRTPVHIYDEQTLVSSTSIQNRSTSQLSLNSHEESVKDDLKYESVKENTNINNKNVADFEESNESSSIIKCNDNVHDDSIDEMNGNDHSRCLLSEMSQNVVSDVEEEEKEILTDVTADSIYCDEFVVPGNLKTEEIQRNRDLQGSKSVLQVSISCGDKDEECDKQCVTYEEVTSMPPEVQLTSENLVFQKLEEISGNEDTENYFNATSAKDANCENWQCNKDDLSSATFFSGNTSCENTEDLSNDLCVRKESKDSLKVALDIDSSSVRSDCCQSSNIYDIHVINSEHSSVDENQISNGEDCRVQSPEHSEKSCTESVMYDCKSICQNEPLYEHILDPKTFCKKCTESSQESLKNVKNESGKVSNSSCNFANLEKSKTNEIIRRSLSLPEKISNFRGTDAFTIQKTSYNECTSSSNKFCYTSDKSTFTVDENVFKSTATLNTIDPYFNKKDVATTPLRIENSQPFTKNKSVATSLKDNSVLIMKVLPPVAVLQARARSYVFGSIGPTQSLLGNEELSRFFPDNKVTIFVGTWNMNGHNSPESIDDFLLPLDISSVPDIYAVGVQESMQSRSEWEILLQTTLGPSHVLFASTSFGVLHLSIFMRRDLIWFCSEPEEASIATRPGSMIKTKGAVAICFLFFGTSFLFVNSHLTAHEQKLRERLSDYEKIISSLDLPKQIPLKPHQKGKDVTSRFDCVFWCGDLNFRVVQDRPSVLSFVEEKVRRQSSCNSLMEHDQLTQAMAKGVVFSGFNEGVINFIPSYKFDVGTSLFDSTKERVPSYTDRILYRCRDQSSITCLHYNAVREIFTSDHKPVYGVFKVLIKPGRDNIPLAGGLFKREIYLEAIKRRSQQLAVNRNHKQSTICSVM